MVRKKVLLIATNILLVSCMLPIHKVTMAEYTQERFHTPITNQVLRAKVGEYLVRNADFKTVETITPNLPIEIKGKNWLNPDFRLLPISLTEVYTRGGYRYYLSDARDHNIKQTLLNDLRTDARIAFKGAKQSVHDHTIRLVALASDGRTEHEYDCPKNIVWTKGRTYAPNKNGHEVSLMYLGIDKEHVLFQYKKYDNKTGWRSSVSSRNLLITVPKDQKQVLIDNDKLTINIIEAQPTFITYKLNTTQEIPKPHLQARLTKKIIKPLSESR